VREKPWLVLDTATPIAVVGVVGEDGVLAEHRMSETRRHAEGLIDAIDRALLAAGVAMPDLAGVGVGRGPGSFIGVRTGIATAKGICLARGLPLVGLPTLLAMAHSVELPAGAGLVLVDAKRGEVYAQLVEKKDGVVRALDPPAALSRAEVRGREKALAFLVGAVDALAREEGSPGAHDVPLVAPTAQGLGAALLERLAAGPIDELDALVPEYCRAPDAKLPSVDPSARRDVH
jgi:tRNA threonylcarbamoyladenosine biosynthesis protein TsaB